MGTRGIGRLAGGAAALAVLLAAVWWAWRVGADHDAVRYLHPGQRLGAGGRVVYSASRRLLFDTRGHRPVLRAASSVLPSAVLLPVLVGAISALLMVLTGRRAWNLAFGWAALRERPLAVGGWTLMLTALVLPLVPLAVLSQAWAAHWPVWLYLQVTIFADRRMTAVLAAAMVVMTLAVALAGPALVDRVMLLRQFAARGREIERRYGSLKAEAAVTEMIEALEGLARRPYKGNLWLSLRLRSELGELLGDWEDERLTASILRTALALPGIQEQTVLGRFVPMPRRLAHQFLIANSLLQEFERTGAQPYLDVAIRILEGLHRRPPVLSSADQKQGLALMLAWLLGRRHSADPAPDGSDLRRALSIAEGAAHGGQEGVADVLGWLEYLRWQHRGGRAEELAILDRAVELLRGGSRLISLATVLASRYRLTGEPADQEEAVVLARDLVARSDLPLSERVPAALLVLRAADGATGPVAEGAAELLPWFDGLPDRYWLAKQAAVLVRMRDAADRDGDEMVDHLEHALLLAVGAASLGLGHRDRRRVLAGEGALAPQDAADLALDAGRPERAVELLELGRTVIWSQMRALHAAVRELPRDAAARAEQLRVELDRPGYVPGPRVPGLLTAHREASGRARLAQEWERLTEGRVVGGRRDFAALCRAAADGPVVVLNLSQFGATAVVVLADRAPLLVPLPGLDRDEARAWAEVLPVGGMNVRGIARRLWDTTAAPVLEAVEPYLGPDRRLWWCPTDALTAVPMHLAGHHGRGDGRTVLDRVVSSHTPSLATLIAARERAAARAGGGGALTVSVSRTLCRPADGGEWPPLAGAAEEGRLIAGRFAGSGSWLADAQATVAAVAAALPGCDRAHFACHGDEDGLVLHDGRLGFEELAELRVDGELAFLSACDTAAPDRLARDEILHPAAALHVRGFAQVVAAVWPVRDEASAELTARFYDRLAGGGTAAAAALHAVQQELRAENPADPARWAAFSHFGC